jgi:hypothetical protein
LKDSATSEASLTTNIAYTDLLKSYFPNARWAEDVDLVGAELSAALRTEAKNSELCAAVRWLAGPEWKGKGNPSLRDLIMAVRIGRKKSREDDSAPAVECGLCRGTGLLEYWPGIHGKQVSLDAYSYAYSLTTPCGCPRGRRNIEHARKRDNPANNSTVTDEAYAARFERARDQAGDRNRLAVARHAASGFHIEELAQRTARVLESDFAGMEVGP